MDRLSRRGIVYLIFVFFFPLPTVVSPYQSLSHGRVLKRVALTFDDGPWPVETYRLRRVLSHHHVSATFFIVGKVARIFPGVVRTLHREGYEIANHSWNHPDISRLPEKRLLKELDRTRRLIEDLTGYDTPFFRTPGSTKNYLLKRFIVPDRYELVLWNVHSLDQEGLTSAEISERVLRSVRDGDILLMHNGIKATALALKTIIPVLKARGFEFVTVSELCGEKRAEHAPSFQKS